MAIDPLAAWVTYNFTPQANITPYELAYIIARTPMNAPGKPIISSIKLQPGKPVDPIFAKHFTKVST